MSNDAFAAALGLAPRALAEYIARGAPTNSPDEFLKWFNDQLKALRRRTSPRNTESDVIRAALDSALKLRRPIARC